jgi:pimeloyl-ACP methyl ester carboxylesterase
MLSRRSALSVATGVLLLGCGPAVARRAEERERAAEAAYPPLGRLVEVGGRRVHAYTQGAGPDVVLLHGASGNLRDMSFSFVRRLTRDHRVTAFDRPGLGWSDDLGEPGLSPQGQAAHLRAAAARLGLRRPVVVGHSYGAAVAMAWALDDPGGVRGVVAVSGATMPWPGGLGAWYSITSSDLGGATVVPLITAYASRERAESAVAGIFAPSGVPRGYVEYVGAGLTLRRESLQVNARQVGALKANLQLMARRYPSLQVPVEIVHGTADGIVPHTTHALRLAERLPRNRLTLIDGAGHMPHHSHGETVAAAVRRLT